MFPMIDMKRTGERIGLFMERRDISAKEVQIYLNLSCVQSVYHWLNGTSMPSIDNFYALSELLGVKMDDMICGNRRSKTKSDNGTLNDRLYEYCLRIHKVV